MPVRDFVKAFFLARFPTGGKRLSGEGVRAAERALGKSPHTKAQSSQSRQVLTELNEQAPCSPSGPAPAYPPAVAAGGPGAETGLGIPEELGNEVDDAVPILDRAGGTRQARGLDEHDVLLGHLASDHNFHKSCFISQGHEDHSGGGTWPLPAHDYPRLCNGNFRQPQPEQ
jgi:hypothetical protein